MTPGGIDADFPPPPHVTPNPHGGDLVLSIPCYVDREHTSGNDHDLIVHEDWTMSVPHDLEAERVVAALGGYVSCLELVDGATKGLETFVRRQLRADPPALRGGLRNMWNLTRRLHDCCDTTWSWPTAQEAAAHWRSARHVAAERGGSPDDLARVGERLLAARRHRNQSRTHEAESLIGRQVVDRYDLGMLWEAGLSPELLVEVHSLVGADEPLGVGFYLGVVTRRPDLRWLRETHARIPERADLPWLAWSETPADRADPELRSQWLQLGAPRRDISLLTASRYEPSDVRRLAGLIGRSPHTAAGLLASCLRAHASPGIVALAEAIKLSDVHPSAITFGALNRLEEGADPVPSREEAALAVITCGSVAIAAEVIKATGSVDPAELRRGLETWEQRRKRRAPRA